MMRLTCWLVGLTLLAAAPARSLADPPKTTPETATKLAIPTPAEIKTLGVQPTALTMKGVEDAQHLIVTGTLVDGRLQDLSGDATYEIANPSIARVTTAGRVIPLTNGSTEITIRYGSNAVKVAVKTESCDVNLPISFGNHIVPIFTKLGCNGGGCHGKSGGQNGFALSLLGFVPEMDYQALVREARGRRLMLSSPDNSLLLTKAAGQVAHGGGKRLEVGSDEYKLIRRWIASGVSALSDKDPPVTKITVYPEHRVVPRNNRQQLAVYAHYGDGSVVDVTQRAQYESNDQDVAVVDGGGLVRTLEMSGEAGVMARYQGQVAVFRATVPLGTKVPDFKFEQRTVVDRYTQKHWQQLAIAPSELCNDEVFIRRVYHDVTGTLPTPAQVKAFSDDKAMDKREKLIDRLLETPEYTYFFANRWADILRVKRGNNANRAFGTFAFHNWIRESVAADKPYDQFAREILGAIGDVTKCPPTFWYTDLQKPEQFVDDTAQLFLGLRIACAQCHHHPYEKWSQDDYWGMAAFFGQVGRKKIPIPGAIGQNQQQNQRDVIYNKPGTAVINKRTNKAAVMVALDAEPVKLQAGEDPRHKLVDWMVAPTNPYFAKAVVNRYWAHFMGRGLVDPIDDMRVTNPPSNPELLDALAKELIDSKFSLKHLIKVIVKSRTYQLSSLPNEYNKQDKKSYARYYPRRMSAEVLFDAVSQVTNSPANFTGLPTDRHSPNRAIMLPDESFKSYFLDVFGRPQRISACECERVSEANLAQALHLLNSNEVQTKLSRAGGRAEALAKDPRSDKEKVEELFLWALARRPNQEQLNVALENISLNAANKKMAYENIIWALINTKEFQFIQ